jgi:hypothetical protein
MPTGSDSAEFVDHDYETSTMSSGTPFNRPAGSPQAPSSRPPTREQVEMQVNETQARLEELKRAQEKLERERSQLEDLRRRQTEFQTGREEMAQHLTRGVGLLEEAEFDRRREAEQMAQTLLEFREGLERLQSIKQEEWTQENYNIELTRALTAIENARMDWNSARLKFGVLNGSAGSPSGREKAGASAPTLATMPFKDLCKVGLAMTWPLVLLAAAVVALLVFKR